MCHKVLDMCKQLTYRIAIGKVKDRIVNNAVKRDASEPIKVIRRIEKYIKKGKYKTAKNYMHKLIKYNNAYIMPVAYYMADIESRERRPIHVAAYLLRIILRMGKDPQNISVRLIENLINAGLYEAAVGINKIFSGTHIYPRINNEAERKRLFGKQIRMVKQKNTEEIEIDTRSKKKEIKISVVFSLYNEGRRFKEAIKIYLKQTAYQTGDVEYIFIDSNSPMQEKRIAQRQLRNKRNILYIRTGCREKLYAALNRGAKHARGKYICFTTPSDYIVIEGLQYMYNVGEKEEADWVQGDAFKEEATPLNMQQAARMGKLLDCGNNFSCEEMLLHQGYITLSVLLKRERFEELKGFNEMYTASGDNDFKIRAASICKIVQTGENLIYSSDCKEKLTFHPRSEIEHYILEANSQREEMIFKLSSIAGIYRSITYTNLLRKALCFRKAGGSQRYAMRPIFAEHIAKYALEEDSSSDIKGMAQFAKDYMNAIRKVDDAMWLLIVGQRDQKVNKTARIAMEILHRKNAEIENKEMGKQLMDDIGVVPNNYGKMIWN